MKRFVMLLITGMVALMMSACGDNAGQKTTETTDTAVVEQSAPAATDDAAAPAAADATTPAEAAPAEAAPATE